MALQYHLQKTEGLKCPFALQCKTQAVRDIALLHLLFEKREILTLFSFSKLFKTPFLSFFCWYNILINLTNERFKMQIIEILIDIIDFIDRVLTKIEEITLAINERIL
jgi:hypothetical protein